MDFQPTGDALEDLRERSLRHAEQAVILRARADAHEHLSDAFAIGAGIAGPEHRDSDDVYEDLIESIMANTPDELLIMEPWGKEGHALIHAGTVDHLAAAFAALVEIEQLAGTEVLVQLLREGPVRLLRRVQHIMLPADPDKDDPDTPADYWDLRPFTVFWLGRYEDIPPTVAEIVHGIRNGEAPW